MLMCEEQSEELFHIKNLFVYLFVSLVLCVSDRIFVSKKDLF